MSFPTSDLSGVQTSVRTKRLERERVRLFRNDLLERMSHTSFTMFLAAWCPALLVLSVLAATAPGPAPVRLALVTAGLPLWTLFEYMMHRVVFHFSPRSAFGKRLVFLLHGNHHVDPRDELRNVIPPGLSLALALLIWGAFRLVFGPWTNPLFLGFACGYVLYDVTHYACHQFPMNGRLLAALKRHHLRHHYVGQEGNYAVTLIFWDRIFGTRLERRARR